MNTVPVNGSFTVDGNNVIRTSQDQIESIFIQFSLETAPAILWWKGVKIFDVNNQMISLLANEDRDHGPDLSPKFTLDRFGEQIKVEIWKAKLLGVHAHVATVFFQTIECFGKLTRLTWEND